MKYIRKFLRHRISWGGSQFKFLSETEAVEVGQSIRAVALG